MQMPRVLRLNVYRWPPPPQFPTVPRNTKPSLILFSEIFSPPSDIPQSSQPTYNNNKPSPSGFPTPSTKPLVFRLPVQVPDIRQQQIIWRTQRHKHHGIPAPLTRRSRSTLMRKRVNNQISTVQRSRLLRNGVYQPAAMESREIRRRLWRRRPSRTPTSSTGTDPMTLRTP